MAAASAQRSHSELAARKRGGGSPARDALLKSPVDGGNEGVAAAAKRSHSRPGELAGVSPEFRFSRPIGEVAVFANAKEMEGMGKDGLGSLVFGLGSWSLVFGLGFGVGS